MITKIDVVLARTEYSSNLGATARAMANLGADRLILVDPKCELNSKAKQAAAGAQQKLQEHIRHADWSEFYSREPEGFRIALTRRGGSKRRVLPLEDVLKAIAKKRARQPLYLIFGPEADGLDSSDLKFVHECCHLPVYGDFASYNLAQAALLTLFIVRQQFPVDQLPRQTSGDPDPPARDFYFPDDAIRDWLTAMGFDVNARRSSAYLTLKRLFLQKLPTQHEMQVLESILQQNIRKLKDRTTSPSSS